MLRTNHIFIDRENVNESELDRIKDKPARLTLIFGANQKTVPLSLTRRIQQYAGQIEIIETQVQGKNALDIVLAYEIGRRAATDPSGYFHVIAKDRDYDSLLKHLKQSGIHASRSASLCGIPLFMTRAERAEFIVGHIGKTAATRPGKRKGLENTIQSAFARSLADEDLQHLVNRLVQAKVLTLGDNDQVEYSAGPSSQGTRP